MAKVSPGTGRTILPMHRTRVYVPYTMLFSIYSILIIGEFAAVPMFSYEVIFELMHN